MRTIIALLAVALLPAPAAAQSISGGGDSGGDQNAISSEQLRQLEGFSAWEIVNRVRPQWLQSRGMMSVVSPEEQAAIDLGDADYRFPVAKVVVDGLPFGELTELRSLP